MKVPLSWLRDYVELPASVAQLAERLTLAGLEVSGVRVLGLPVPDGLKIKDEDAGPVWQRDKIIIGKVLSVERHPKADRLTLATVDYGVGQPKTVVTGAPNIKVGDAGQKVIVALSGSVLFDGHAEQKVLRELKPSTIRGVASDAMVCSAYELGISDEHEGIIILEDEAPVGTPLVDFMGDVVLELEVTPNMARCLSMIGVAREVAALTGQILHLPAHVGLETEKGQGQRVTVQIEDAQLCCFPRGRFEAFLTDHPQMEHELYRMAAHELSAAQQQLVLLGRKTATERLASFLLLLAERADRLAGEKADVVDFPMGRADIADYLGLTKETVSRIISAFRASRLIRLRALNKVEILDRPALRQIADGEG